jgi:hypothetical protein
VKSAKRDDFSSIGGRRICESWENLRNGSFALCKLNFGRADALQIACLTRAYAVSSASQMKKHIKKESPWLNYESRAFCFSNSPTN